MSGKPIACVVAYPSTTTSGCKYLVDSVTIFTFHTTKFPNISTGPAIATSLVSLTVHDMAILAPTKFDMAYYFSTHMPMIDKYWGPYGMKSWSVAEFSPALSLDGSMPPYIVQTTVYWDSVEDLKKALGAPESEETGADIAKFSDVHPVIWVSEVQGAGTL